jgi:16S rRNA (uracil1498-N3)-methyltransferase
MTDRFFVDVPIAVTQVLLSGPEAHHLAHVLRAGVGDEVILFDGTGAEFPARIGQIDRKRIELTVLERREVDRELPIGLTLGVALPKGERRRWLVEKAVELGVRRLVPLQTARGMAPRQDSPGERLERAVVEASKQCGRNRLMTIAPSIDLVNFLRTAPADQQRWIAHPGGQALPLDGFPCAPGGGYCLAVGPEGGFTEAEVRSAMELGWQALDLGPRLLRVETAALALVALIALRSR